MNRPTNQTVKEVTVVVLALSAAEPCKASAFAAVRGVRAQLAAAGPCDDRGAGMIGQPAMPYFVVAFS